MRDVWSRRGRWAGVAVALAVLAGLVATLLVWAPPESPRPVQLARPEQEQPASSAEARLRDRLGGLAGILIGSDPLLTECADPEPTAPLPDNVEDPDGLAALTALAETLRGETLDEPPEVQFLDDAGMTSRVTEFFGSQWDEERIDLDQRALTALGAIAPGTDLAELRIDTFAEQVSGYHLGGEGLIGVRTTDPGALTPLERTVLVHELEHALSFTRVGRPADHRDGDETADTRRASSAVVEGSAVVTMLQYATAVLDPAERVILRDELRERAQTDGVTDYSPYLRAELRFPYVEGVRYICRRWLAGGWDAVNTAFTDPPASTAAILFPDRHDERPRRPDRLGDPPGGWERARSSAFGAAELEWLLAAPGGDTGAALDDTRGRVAAWDGGQLVVWTDGPDTAVGLALVDRGEGPPLCGTVREWYAAAFPEASMDSNAGRTGFAGGRQQAVLSCPGREVRLGIAPTAEDAQAITG